MSSGIRDPRTSAERLGGAAGSSLSRGGLRDVLRSSVLDLPPLKVMRGAVQLAARLSRAGVAPPAGGRISDEEWRLPTRMREANVRTGPPFAPSVHWRELVDGPSDEAFHRDAIGTPEDQPYNVHFSGYSVADHRLHRYVCEMHARLLEPRDHLGLLDRLRAGCREANGSAYRFGHRLLSLDLLLSMDDFYNLYERDVSIAEGPIVVCEVGAGWDRVAHVVLSVNPSATYVICDLPEPLLISQRYLPILHPEASFMRYDRAAGLPLLERGTLLGASLWFLGLQDLERITPGSLDLVLNIGGFPEMPADYSERHLGLFGRAAQGGHVYLNELVARSSHGSHRDEIEGLARYQIPGEWDTRFLRPATFSSDFFEAGWFVPPQQRLIGTASERRSPR